MRMASEELFVKACFQLQPKSFPFEGKVPRNEADEVEMQKNTAFCGSDEHNAIISLYTSSVTYR